MHCRLTTKPLMSIAQVLAVKPSVKGKFISSVRSTLAQLIRRVVFNKTLNMLSFNSIKADAHSRAVRLFRP